MRSKITIINNMLPYIMCVIALAFSLRVYYIFLSLYVSGVINIFLVLSGRTSNSISAVGHPLGKDWVITTMLLTAIGYIILATLGMSGFLEKVKFY
jgi:hypothetical protein